MKTGYKQTDIGIIPEDWDTPFMGDLAQIQRGASPRPISSPIWFDDKSSVGWLRISDVSKSKKYLKETTQHLSEAGIANSRYVAAQNLVMSICATVGRPIITHKNLCIHDGFVVFDQIKADKEYMYYALSNIENDWAKYGQTGSQMNLNTGLINGTRIPLPKPEEQKQIAAALSDVDGLIDSLEKLIIKKRGIKTAAMQQLLTGKKRLPGFDGEWAEYQIKEFTHCIAGGTPSTLIDEYWNGQIRWMSSGELNNKFIYDVLGRITELGLKSSSANMVPEKCVLIGLAGQGKTRGTAAINFVSLSTNQSIAAIFPSYKHCSLYLYYSLDSRYHELRELSSGGGGRGGLNLSIINKISIPFPSLEEQKAISQILFDIDVEIDALEQRLEKARSLKMGMMQELLTGKTRLIKTNKKQEAA